MKRLSLVIIAFIMALAFTACSGGARSPSNSSTPSIARESAPAPGAASGAEYPAEAEQGYLAEYASNYAAPQDYYGDYKYADESATELPLLTPDNSDGTKLVYTVEIKLQTVTFMEGIRFLMDTVSDAGGYVLRSHVQGRGMFIPDVERYARYELQIPSTKLSQFIYDMEDNYNLLGMDQTSQDITYKYEETGSRLEDLLEQERRLLESLEAAGDTDDVYYLEGELSQVQGQIGRLTASTSAMDKAVAYSSVTIHLHEVIPPEPEEEDIEPVWGDRMEEAASGSLNRVLAFFQNLLVVFITSLPALLLLAAIIFAALSARKRIKKNKSAPTED